MKLSSPAVRTDLPPPLLGQHTNEVLRDELHRDAKAVAQLRQKRVI